MTRAILLAILLTGCVPQPVIRPVDVPVPVTKPCIVASDIPAAPVSHMTPGVNIERLAAAVSADLRELTIYATKLRALLVACVE